MDAQSQIPQELKLMADYSAWPLWGRSGGDVDPATLPLSVDLRERLNEWAAAYDAILNRDDPRNSGFPSPEVQAAWEQEGLHLWRDLQRELGSDYAISYFSHGQQRVLRPHEAPTAERG